MGTAKRGTEQGRGDDRLHLSDLPRWWEWVLLCLAAALALGGLYALSDALDASAVSITTSSIFRGVPPSSWPQPPLKSGSLAARPI